MFTHKKKKKAAKRAEVKAAGRKRKFKSKICGACGYQRKPADSNPSWQCPCCQAAYVKVSQSYVKQQKQKRTEAHLKRMDKIKSRAEKERIATNVLSGTSLGGLMVAKGAGLLKTCGGALMTNPWTAGIGGIILLGTLIYFLSAVGG